MATKHQMKARRLSQREVSIVGEADYVVKCAAQCDARVVTLGPLLFFSTGTGDAWVLDPEDELARCLARGGDPLPSGISETEERFSVEWTATYRIERDAVVFTEGSRAEHAVIGYPVAEIRRAIGRMNRGKSRWR